MGCFCFDSHLEAHPIFEDPNSLKQVKCPYIYDPAEKYISLIVLAYNEELRLPAALDETMKRNNLGGSTQRYVTKRISLVKCAMDASFSDARDESVIFQRINIKDSYKRLGISKEASEDKIQSARNFLVQKYAGHKPR